MIMQSSPFTILRFSSEEKKRVGHFSFMLNPGRRISIYLKRVSIESGSQTVIFDGYPSNIPTLQFVDMNFSTFDLASWINILNSRSWHAPSDGGAPYTSVRHHPYNTNACSCISNILPSLLKKAFPISEHREPERYILPKERIERGPYMKNTPSRFNVMIFFSVKRNKF